MAGGKKGAGRTRLPEQNGCNSVYTHLTQTYALESTTKNLSELEPGDQRHFVSCLTLLTVACIVCYANSLRGEFVHDDVMAVKKNKDVRPSTPLIDLFRNDFWGRPMNDNTSHKSYRPFCVLTFRINYLLGGLDPYGYHIMNLLIHILVSLLFAWMCKKVLHWKTGITLIAGLMFAAHPIHSEAVSGIVGRADVLACFFYLLAFIAFCRSVESNNYCLFPSTINPWLFCISLMLGGIAMLTKEHGVTVLALLLLYDIFVLCRKGITRIITRQIKPIMCLPFLKRSLWTIIMLLSLLSFRVWMLNGDLPLFSDQDNPAAFSPQATTRCFTYCYILAFNCWLLLAPIILSYDWQMGSIPLVESPWDSRNLATSIFILSFVTLLLYCMFIAKGRTYRSTFLGLSFLIVPFIPACNFFLTVGFVVAERILYIPSIGFCILVAHGLDNLCRRYKKFASFFYGCALLSILALGCRTISRNKVWLTRDALFRSGLDSLPHNAKVHYNYANLMKDLGNIEEAIRHYHITLQLWPHHASANNNLGTLVADPIEAERLFRTAIQINPHHAHAHFNLANLLSKMNKFEEAIILLQRALHIDPDYTDAMSFLASLLGEIGRNEEANYLHQQILMLEPDNPDVYNNYGVFLQNIGKRDESLEFYKKALRLQNNHTVVLTNAARLLRLMQRNDEAEEMFIRSLNVQRDPTVMSSLAAVYFNTGRIKEARDLYEEILEKMPDNLEARVHYAQVLMKEEEYAESEALLKAVIAENKTHLDALHQLSNLYAFLKRHPEQALEFSHQALMLCQMPTARCAQIYADHGNHLRDVNRMEEAAQHYKRAVDIHPTFGIAHMNLGVIYHMKKDYKQAHKHYNIALQYEPNNLVLKDNMKKLLRAINKDNIASSKQRNTNYN